MTIKQLFEQCNDIAQNSDCKRGKVGAILIRKNNSIIGTGYNTIPNKTPCTNTNCDMSKRCKQTVHAEIAALLNINSRKDLYAIILSLSPCLTCAKIIVYAGIQKVYYDKKYSNPDGINYLKNNGIKIIQKEELK